MKRHSNAEWNAVELGYYLMLPFSEVLDLAQTQVAQAMHWSSNRLTQARTWVAEMNSSAGHYSKRLMAAARSSK